MTVREFIRGELIDIVEWLEDSQEAMAWRFVRPNNEIKNGAQPCARHRWPCSSSKARLPMFSSRARTNS